MDPATLLALIVYLLGVLLSALMLSRTFGRSFDELITKSRDEHHAMTRIFEKHPRGGAWRDFRKWLGDGR